MTSLLHYRLASSGDPSLFSGSLFAASSPHICRWCGGFQQMDGFEIWFFSSLHIFRSFLLSWLCLCSPFQTMKRLHLYDVSLLTLLSSLDVIGCYSDWLHVLMNVWCSFPVYLYLVYLFSHLHPLRLDRLIFRTPKLFVERVFELCNSLERGLARLLKSTFHHLPSSCASLNVHSIVKFPTFIHVNSIQRILSSWDPSSHLDVMICEGCVSFENTASQKTLS